MTEQQSEKTSRRTVEPSSQDLAAGQGRRDEVSHTGIHPSSGPYPEGEAPILTPDINEPHERRDSDVQGNEDVTGAERLPRKGDEIDDLIG
jgi:hypothetical protein